MESSITRKRAELSGKATNILDSRTLAYSHKRLVEQLKEGMSVLDIGCGTGAITRGIAEMVGPKGRVVGIDSNPVLIDKAQQLYGAIQGLTFETGDIFNLNYQNEFDIVTSARVLQWLSSPLKALDMMKSATKFGGRILVLDYNHKKIYWEPEPPSSVKSFYSAFLKWRSDAGMDNTIADNLSNLFKEVGMSDIVITPQHEIVKRGDPDFDSRISIWADVMASRGLQMVEDGYIMESERAVAEMEYRKWADETATSQTMYLLAVEGLKN